MRSWDYAGLAAAATGTWLAVYRLPLSHPRVRQRFRLAVASRTGVDIRYVMPIAGTAIYLLSGLAAIVLLQTRSPVGLVELLDWRPGLSGIALTALAALGASALTGFAMSLLYTLRPGVDVPGAIAGVRWIQEVLALPRAWRWVAPMGSAAIEEFFFRGVVLIGLLGTGAPEWLAIGAAGLLFTTGQVLLTENRLQALVLAVSSVVLSIVGGILVVVAGSVLPAIAIHAVFAGYYTNAPTGSPSAPARAATHT